MNQIFDAMQAAAVAGFGISCMPGKDHIDSGELIGRRSVNGEEAVAAKGAEIVERALPWKAHHEIRGGDVAFEAGEFDAAVPESGKGKADLIDEGSVVAVEGGFHALDRAGIRSPERFFKGDGIGAGTQ